MNGKYASIHVPIVVECEKAQINERENKNKINFRKIFSGLIRYLWRIKTENFPKNSHAGVNLLLKERNFHLFK